ncbi:hypothetical protein GCM10009541_37090 [Micromonospora gifhornensis]|uniref:Uncharacterized protein n=1 Tax=Micromonospora gifhornensis TaxID=84594 RepID=A0ABQ4IK24_9ACTN|nr:hypothetical protein Vgi01_49380 [Micromonospora gifhornensis]
MARPPGGGLRVDTDLRREGVGGLARLGHGCYNGTVHSAVPPGRPGTLSLHSDTGCMGDAIAGKVEIRTALPVEDPNPLVALSGPPRPGEHLRGGPFHLCW